MAATPDLDQEAIREVVVVVEARRLEVLHLDHRVVHHLDLRVHQF